MLRLPLLLSLASVTAGAATLTPSHKPAPAQTQRPAVATAASATADSPALARYPYLTDLTTSSVDVVWATDASDATGGVRQTSNR